MEVSWLWELAKRSTLKRKPENNLNLGRQMAEESLVEDGTLHQQLVAVVLRSGLCMADQEQEEARLLFVVQPVDVFGWFHLSLL